MNLKCRLQNDGLFIFGFNVLNSQGVALRIVAIIYQTRCFQMKNQVSNSLVSIDMCLIKYAVLQFLLFWGPLFEICHIAFSIRDQRNDF